MGAQSDWQQRFLFEHADVRGELIRLEATYQQALQRRTYPGPVAALLGEAMAAAGLLASTLKFEGSVTLQIQADGPLTLLVAQCWHDRHLRAMAKLSAGKSPEGALAELCGRGHLAITIEPIQGKERYQGIVGLDQPTLSAAVEAYFERSEQLPTRLFLACDGRRAAGLLLQRMPGGQRHGDADAWNRAQRLAATVTAEELLSLDGPELLRRLFHEETIRLFEPLPVGFRCACSRTRIAAVIQAMGWGEAQQILGREGSIRAECDFCGHTYVFDAVDVTQLFNDGGSEPPAATRH